jgi:uncharacterized membrane-anchored protein YhcB (DUF1043 family)
MVTWFEQNTVALIGLIVGVVIVVLQLNRQHRSTLQIQQDNAREKLKLRLHEILVQKVRKLSHANLSAAMYANMILYNWENFQRRLALGITPLPIKERAPEFLKLHTEANNALNELIEEFISWSIAFPGLQIFQVALLAANHDAWEAFKTLFTALPRVLPIDPPEGVPENVPGPIILGVLSNEETIKLKELVARYKDAMDDIRYYIQDLTIEAQNNLLSGLFNRRVPPRKPLDPTHKVISTEPAQAARLLLFFENETAWGKAKAIAEKDAISRYESK